MSQGTMSPEHRPAKGLGSILHELSQTEAAARRDDESDAYGIRIHKLLMRFVGAAILITLSFGTVWGVSILTKAAGSKGFTAPDPAAVQAHAHAQVFGWIGLFIMGILYTIYPQIKKVRLRCVGAAEASFWLMAGGIVIRSICQPFADNAVFASAVFVSAVLEIAAATLFVRAVIFAFMDSHERWHASDCFILASLVWLCVALAINLGTTLEIARTGNPVIPEGINVSRINAEVFGFIIAMLLGIGMRLLPQLAGMNVVSKWAGATAAGLFGIGVVAKTFGISQSVGSGLIAVAIVVLVTGLGVFKGSSRTEPFPSLRLWIQVACFWLVVGGMMMFGADVYAAVTGREAAHVWVGAYRHAVVVGFITTMVVGMAFRLVPLLHGSPLQGTRLVSASFYLLLTGNAARVIFQSLTLTKSPVAYAVAGLSGYVELTALICFGLSILMTIKCRPASKIAGHELSQFHRLSVVGKKVH